MAASPRLRVPSSYLSLFESLRPAQHEESALLPRRSHGLELDGTACRSPFSFGPQSTGTDNGRRPGTVPLFAFLAGCFFPASSLGRRVYPFGWPLAVSYELGRNHCLLGRNHCLLGHGTWLRRRRETPRCYRCCWDHGGSLLRVCIQTYTVVICTHGRWVQRKPGFPFHRWHGCGRGAQCAQCAHCGHCFSGTSHPLQATIH